MQRWAMRTAGVHDVACRRGLSPRLETARLRLGLLSRLSGSLACRVVIRHRLGESVGSVVLCGCMYCIMHGGCISPLETLSDARLKHMSI